MYYDLPRSFKGEHRQRLDKHINKINVSVFGRFVCKQTSFPEFARLQRLVGVDGYLTVYANPLSSHPEEQNISLVVWLVKKSIVHSSRR